MSFSAWGNRRLSTTWEPPVGAAETLADHNANRYGFTHQEMLDNVGIIHMNGRIYDPNLGRFLSVDPVFEFPTNTQSLNPYSYVLNNPLSLTDPTGYTVAAACPTGQTCPADNGIKPGDTATITIKTTATPTGSHIAQTTTTTLTGVAQKDGSVAVYSSTSTQNGGSNSQGPASGTTLGTSTNQGGNTSPAATAKVTTSNAVTNTQSSGNTTPPEQKWVNPTGGAIRGCDATYGCGNWGAPRDEGQSKSHKGTDYLSDPGQTVKAVTDGKVVRFGYPYGDTKKLTLIIIRAADGTQIRELYVNPTDTVNIGEKVKAGQVIGTAEDLGSKFPGIPNHVHVDIKQNGIFIDPSTKIPIP